MRSPAPPFSSRTLLDLARRGSWAALGRLLARHRSELVSLARGSLGPKLGARLEAEDLYQEAVLQAMRSITSLRARDFPGFRRWFRGIVRHRIFVHIEAARHRRQPRRTTALPSAHLSYQDPTLLPLAQSSAVVDPEPRYVVDENGDLMPDGRLAVLLRGFFESGWDTVAFLLDRPTSEAARQVYVRARTRLLLD